MLENERIWNVKVLISGFVKSPSLRHLRDPHSIAQVAREIVRQLDRSDPLWTKWNDCRNTLVKMAVGCWVPLNDLRYCLNSMPGPALSFVDVEERMKAFEIDLSLSPNPDLRDYCLSTYERERLAGTEMSAIVSHLHEWVYKEEVRIYEEEKRQATLAAQEARQAEEMHLMSGADCKWTKLSASINWYCRLNGRSFRLTPSEDKTWQMFRVAQVNDAIKGRYIGRYRTKRDATQAVSGMAFKPEPRDRLYEGHLE